MDIGTDLTDEELATLPKGRHMLGIIGTYGVDGYVPAQPAPSVPREAIEKMLTQLMDIAVSNGANSVSMPDEYVEVAAWLCGIPAQPAPSVPNGWKEAAIAWEVCASIHREYGKGKDPFFNTRQGDFVKHANDARAMLAAAPEAKP